MGSPASFFSSPSCLRSPRNRGENRIQMAPAHDGGVTQTLQSIYIPPLLNAPFSAVVNTDWARPIPGGGTYTLVNARHVARDSRGRIYEERWLLVPKGGDIESRRNVIQIADPAAHTLYNCFPLQEPHRCYKLAFDEPAIAVFKPAAIVPGPLASGKGFSTHEDLGLRTIEGIDTHGSRDSTTLNIGAIGNDRPVVTTREFWFAEPLGINLLSILDDPQAGKQTFRLSEVTRSEPDPQLFELPEGYEVVDQARN